MAIEADSGVTIRASFYYSTLYIPASAGAVAIRLAVQSVFAMLARNRPHTNGVLSSSATSISDWIVCIASFLCMFVCETMGYCYGILLLSISETFSDKTKLSAVGSVLLGSSLLVGPVVSWLLSRYSCRQVIIGGGLLASAAFAASSFSTTPEMLIVMYGVIGGAAYGLVYVTAIVMVGLRFTRHRALATGIALSGGGMGVLVMGYPIELLTEAYGWRGTILIMAGLFLNCCVFGALVFPPREKRNNISVTFGSQNGGKDGVRVEDGFHKTLTKSDNGINGSNDSFYKEIKWYPADRKTAGSTESLPMDKNEDSPSLPKTSAKMSDICSVNDLCKTRNGQTTNSSGYSFKPDDLSPVHKRDICTKTCDSAPVLIQDEVQQEMDTPRQEATDKERYTYLAKSVTFYIVLLVMCFWTGIFTVLIYLPGLAVSKGISRPEASLVVSLFGISNVLGRVLSGTIVSRTSLSSVHLYAICLFVAGVDVCILPHCVTLVHFIVTTVIFGLCSATMLSMRTIILVDTLGVELLTTSFGVVCAAQGVCEAIGPPISGVLYKWTGSFLAAFYLVGGLLCMAAVLCALVTFRNKCQIRPLDRLHNTSAGVS